MQKVKEHTSASQYTKQEYSAWEAIYNHIKENPVSMKKDIIEMLMDKLILFRKE